MTTMRPKHALSGESAAYQIARLRERVAELERKLEKVLDAIDDHADRIDDAEDQR